MKYTPANKMMVGLKEWDEKMYFGIKIGLFRDEKTENAHYPMFLVFKKWYDWCRILSLNIDF